MPFWKKWTFYRGLIEVLGLFGLGFYCFFTYRQWDDLRENFKVDERSWISPTFAWNSDKVFGEGDSYVPDKMFDGDVVLRLTNTGKIPILRTETHVWIQILDHDSAPNLNWQGVHSASFGSFLFPGRHADLENRRSHADQTIFNPTDDEIRAMRKGTDYVAAYGYTIYSDSFGEHWTRFCAYWRYTTLKLPLTPLPNVLNVINCVALNAVGDGLDPIGGRPASPPMK